MLNCFSFVPEGVVDCQVKAYLQETWRSKEIATRKVPSIIICPGGAYSNVSDREHFPVGREYLAAGYHVFILTYSVKEEAKFIENGSLSKKSIGLAIVSDEETTSLMGISHLIDEGCFSEDDVIIVPDWGVPGGTMIEVAEKHLLWFKVCVTGKQIHGSIPDKGLNSFRISADLICKLSDRLKEKFGNSNPIFRPSVSTFEPTKSYSDPVSVNIIPGYFEFYMDCRILPEYDPEIVFDYVKRIVSEYSEETEAEIEVVLEQMTFSGKPSSTDSEAFKAFRESVEAVVDGKVETVGVGGGTCANFFRLKGMDAYVWQTGGGTLHQPNEHVFVSNIISDAKVYANLFYRLCV